MQVMLRDEIKENGKVVGFQYAIDADSYGEAYQKALEMYREDKNQYERELFQEAFAHLLDDDDEEYY